MQESQHNVVKQFFLKNGLKMVFKSFPEHFDSKIFRNLNECCNSNLKKRF